MIPVVVAAVSAAVLAAVAVSTADRAHVLARFGRERTDLARARPSLQAPGLLWRGWPVVAALAGWLAGSLPGVVIAAVGAFAASSAVRRRRSARLAAALEEQLADGVRSIAAGMRAGLSVPQAIAHAAREGDQPLSDALERVVDTVELGGELDAALRAWATEVGSEDARLVVGVLGLHRRTGGDLPRVLDQVASTVRERTSVAREVRALTTQARLSGAILGLLPIGFFGFLWMTSRGEIEGAFRSPVGLGAVVTGLLLEALAFAWIRKLLEVK